MTGARLALIPLYDRLEKSLESAVQPLQTV